VTVVEVGDEIEIETERVGQPARAGVVTAVRGQLLTIRWNDGRESTFMPKSGSLRLLRHPTEHSSVQN
jgi:hypothetical protein